MYSSSNLETLGKKFSALSAMIISVVANLNVERTLRQWIVLLLWNSNAVTLSINLAFYPGYHLTQLVLVVEQLQETPLPEQLREIFDESQLMRKIDFALTTKAYLIAKEIESAMISDRKEDSQLIKTSYTLECPSSQLLCDVDKKEELSNRLHGLLLRVTNV
jgi:hypothetical protein